MEIVSTQGNATAANPPTERVAADSRVPFADFEQFLNLFVSQLKYQDPLSPMASDQFMAQTAQFSTVEQLVNLNTKVGDSAAAAELFGRATAAALIGRTATAHAVDGEGAETTVSGRVVRVDYGSGGNLLLGLEDGTSLPLTEVVTLSQT